MSRQHINNLASELQSLHESQALVVERIKNYGPIKNSKREKNVLKFVAKTTDKIEALLQGEDLDSEKIEKHARQLRSLVKQHVGEAYAWLIEPINTFILSVADSYNQRILSSTLKETESPEIVPRLDLQNYLGQEAMILIEKNQEALQLAYKDKVTQDELLSLKLALRWIFNKLSKFFKQHETIGSKEEQEALQYIFDWKSEIEGYLLNKKAQEQLIRSIDYLGNSLSQVIESQAVPHSTVRDFSEWKNVINTCVEKILEERQIIADETSDESWDYTWSEEETTLLKEEYQKFLERTTRMIKGLEEADRVAERIEDTLDLEIFCINFEKNLPKKLNQEFHAGLDVRTTPRISIKVTSLDLVKDSDEMQEVDQSRNVEYDEIISSMTVKNRESFMSKESENKIIRVAVTFFISLVRDKIFEELSKLSKNSNLTQEVSISHLEDSVMDLYFFLFKHFQVVEHLSTKKDASSHKISLKFSNKFHKILKKWKDTQIRKGEAYWGSAHKHIFRGLQSITDILDFYIDSHQEVPELPNEYTPQVWMLAFQDHLDTLSFQETSSPEEQVKVVPHIETSADTLASEALDTEIYAQSLLHGWGFPMDFNTIEEYNKVLLSAFFLQPILENTTLAILPDASQKFHQTDIATISEKVKSILQIPSSELILSLPLTNEEIIKDISAYFKVFHGIQAIHGNMDELVVYSLHELSKLAHSSKSLEKFYEQNLPVETLVTEILQKDRKLSIEKNVPYIISLEEQNAIAALAYKDAFDNEELSVIADTINEEFHGGLPLREVKDITNVLMHLGINTRKKPAASIGTEPFLEQDEEEPFIEESEDKISEEIQENTETPSSQRAEILDMQKLHLVSLEKQIALFDLTRKTLFSLFDLLLNSISHEVDSFQLRKEEQVEPLTTSIRTAEKLTSQRTVSPESLSNLTKQLYIYLRALKTIERAEQFWSVAHMKRQQLQQELDTHHREIIGDVQAIYKKWSIETNEELYPQYAEVESSWSLIEDAYYDSLDTIQHELQSCSRLLRAKLTFFELQDSSDVRKLFHEDQEDLAERVHYLESLLAGLESKVSPSDKEKEMEIKAKGDKEFDSTVERTEIAQEVQVMQNEESTVEKGQALTPSFYTEWKRHLGIQSDNEVLVKKYALRLSNETLHCTLFQIITVLLIFGEQQANSQGFYIQQLLDLNKKLFPNLNFAKKSKVIPITTTSLFDALDSLVEGVGIKLDTEREYLLPGRTDVSLYFQNKNSFVVRYYRITRNKRATYHYALTKKGLELARAIQVQLPLQGATVQSAYELLRTT